MDYAKRVKYISPIVPPVGISRYQYYEFNIDKEIVYIINDNKNKLEFEINEFRKIFIPEVGSWDNTVKISKKIDTEQSNIKDNLKKYL